jgi:hypothetical protein
LGSSNVKDGNKSDLNSEIESGDNLKPGDNLHQSPAKTLTTTSNLLENISTAACLQGTSRGVTDYFSRSLDPTTANDRLPRRTFTHGSFAFHLLRNPSMKDLVDNIANIYRIPES